MASFYLSADALVERDDEYLMVREGKGHVEDTWSIPGGGIEHGEDPLTAVKREVFEETGLEVTDCGGLIGVMYGNASSDGHPAIVLVFSCEVEAGKPEPEFDEEVLNAKFMSLEEIEERELRNDRVISAIELEKNSEPLPDENFRRYVHPFLDED